MNEVVEEYFIVLYCPYIVLLAPKQLWNFNQNMAMEVTNDLSLESLAIQAHLVRQTTSNATGMKQRMVTKELKKYAIISIT